ncbi:MAG: hypothetical protein M0Z27_01635 [Thermaerobacter sp.]|nr:hypothetical protein [Thermaerobacter sp.]
MMTREREMRLERVRRLLEEPVVAVLRTRTSEEAARSGMAMAAGGIRRLEVTFSVPDAPAVMRELARDTEAMVGAGSILSVEDGIAALEGGADFLVAPLLLPELVPLAREAGAAVILGGITPTEILAARRAGADLVKVFPVDCVGGPLFLEEVLPVLRDVPVMVSGGVDETNLREYLARGASMAALGDVLTPEEEVARGDSRALAERARRFVALARGGA